ncbi:MAG: amino acid adenylation domain-containing protein [Armatimonadota bacterium]
MVQYYAAKHDQGQVSLSLLLDDRRFPSVWCENRTDYPRDACIQTLFAACAANTPDAVAVVCGGESLTYEALNRRANQLAHHLRALGVGPDVPVGLSLPRSCEMVVALLAILKAGGGYVPLSPEYPRERLSFMVRDVHMPLLVTTRDQQAHLPVCDVDTLFLDDLGDSLAHLPETNPDCATTAEHLAYVIFTSGSTGMPKGVAVPHRGVVRLVRNTNYIDIHPDDTFLQFAPLAFDASTFEIWGALLNGARLVLMPPEASALDHLAATIREQSVTILWLTSALFNVMIDHEPEALQPLRCLLTGGEALSVPHVQRALELLTDCQLINGYGPTENTTFTCCFPIPREYPLGASVPIGRPIANTEVYLLNADLLPVTAGEVGELYTGGDGLARGYLNRPELTAERFIVHPFSDDPAARLYRTGDLARYLPDGLIEFLGRVDNQVKIRGFRIEPGEIETALCRHPQVADACVIAREDTPGEKRLVAYVVPRSGQQLTPADIRYFLGDSLPEYMIPSALVPLQALPLNANGKVDRTSLPVPRTGRICSPDPPRGETEIQVAALWTELFHLPLIHRDDHFLELGGHSLLAARLASKIRASLRVQIPLGAIFDHPTVAALAEVIDRLRDTDAGEVYPPILPTSRDRRLPLSLPQQQVWFLDQLTPGNRAYNMQVTIRFRGALEIGALTAALTEIVRRHEILRTTFPALDGAPSQVIHPPYTVQIPLIDLTGFSAGEREAQAEAKIRSACDHTFDVTQLPLIRWTLLRLHEDEHILVQVEHHLIHDGWSFGILMRELRALYMAFHHAEQSPLPGLSLQFADVAAWQQQWLDGKAFERQLAYWTAELVDCPPPLELPTDRSRPAVQSFRGDRLDTELPADLCATIRAFSRQEGASLFMTLLATFAVLLSRYSGQQDLLIGSGMANRTQAETEPLIGMLVNTLPLRMDLSGVPTFREVVRRVRATTLGAYAHQDIPLERLVHALRLERDLSKNPLFQVLFSFHDSAVPDLHLPDVTGTIAYRHNGTAKFDLNLIVIPHAEQQVGQHVETANAGVQVLWEYATDLFDAVTIAEMQTAFLTMLQAVMTQPDTPINDIPVLTDNERGISLPEWCACAVPSVSPIESEKGEYLPATDALELQLVAIWEQVLKVHPVGVEDNFFDIGGHSLLAMQLFARISKATGVRLPLATLFQAPTIRGLAALLRQEGWRPQFTSLVPIQTGGSKPPLFCVAAPGQYALSYRDLSLLLGQEQPFYGLQEQGLDVHGAAHESIPEMAAHYLREMKAVQPTGPYYLAGVSFGGMVAFEMAQQLHAQGQEVAFVGLFDTMLREVTPHADRIRRKNPQQKTWAYRIARLRRYITQHASWEKLFIFPAQKYTKRLQYWCYHLLGKQVPVTLRDAVSHQFYRELRDTYRLQPYPGTLTLFVALDVDAPTRPTLEEDPTLGWRGIADTLEIVYVPGGHMMIQQPDVKELAVKLAAALQP